MFATVFGLKQLAILTPFQVPFLGSLFQGLLAVTPCLSCSFDFRINVFDGEPVKLQPLPTLQGLLEPFRSGGSRHRPDADCFVFGNRTSQQAFDRQLLVRREVLLRESQDSLQS